VLPLAIEQVERHKNRLKKSQSLALIGETGVLYGTVSVDGIFSSS